MGIDRMSNLPEHIIDKILSHLPIKDAVRTSLLSSEWRHKWAMMPSLVFDFQTLPLSYEEAMRLGNKHTTIVDRVLMLHFGPIHKFEISNGIEVSVHNVCRWIWYLSRNPIKEIIIRTPGFPRDSYIMPSYLFSCQSLTRLELGSCLLRPPSGFKGFLNLKGLHLSDVKLDGISYDELISSSPLLEELTLSGLEGVSCVNIDLPQLRFFNYDSGYARFNLIDTSRLAIASIYLYSPKVSLNFIKFFSNLPNLQRLEGHFIEGLDDEIPRREQPETFGHLIRLKYLRFAVDFSCRQTILKALYLLRCTPNLEEMIIHSFSNTYDEVEMESDLKELNTYFSEADYGNLQLVKLRYIQMDDIYGFQREMDFIDFILSVSPALETMIVLPMNINENTVKKLLQLKRASSQAEIIIKRLLPMNIL